MTLAADIADDYTMFDGVETVTYTPAAGSAVATVKGLRRGMRRSDFSVAATLGAEVNDEVWNLWVSTLGGLTPAAGGTITDAAGTIWEIVSATLGTLNTRWRCIARKQVG